MTATAVAPATYRPPNEAARHYPQLDGLRAVAVGMVVASHALKGQFEALGLYGVGLFFVLSAYLVTGILLRSRDRSFSAAIGTFYARRMLRIFPAYYVVLAALAIANVPGMRIFWPWHVAYLSNWFVFLTGQWPAGAVHLWTLAVEEQFYLTWPLVILLVPTQRIDMLCVAMIALAVATRGTLGTMVTGWNRIGTPTLSCFDALGIGALLALAHHAGIRPRLQRWLVLGLVLVVHGFVLRLLSRGYVLLVATEALGVALVAVWCIARATEGRLPRWTERAPVQYIGRISYGVYLWHVPVMWALVEWWGEPSGFGGRVLLLLATSALSVALASVSWFALEAPLNRLKDRLPMRGAIVRAR